MYLHSTKQLSYFHSGPAWIGLSDLATNGVHRWTNGQVLSGHVNWASDAPNNGVVQGTQGQVMHSKYPRWTRKMINFC